jgi:hypothetical protein
VSSHSSPRRCSLCSADAPRRSAALCRATGSADAPPVSGPTRCRSSARSTLGRCADGRGVPHSAHAPADRSTRPRQSPTAAEAARTIVRPRLDTSAPRRTPRRAAPSSLTHAMPRALRSAQRDKRFGYSALPLPKPRRGHAHSLTASILKASPEKFAPTAVMGGVPSIVSVQSPIVADFSALSGSGRGGSCRSGSRRADFRLSAEFTGENCRNHRGKPASYMKLSAPGCGMPK